MRWSPNKWAILFHILNHPFCTTDEIAQGTSMKINTVRLNARQMLNYGYIRKHKKLAVNAVNFWTITESGRMAIMDNNKQVEAIRK